MAAPTASPALFMEPPLLVEQPPYNTAPVSVPVERKIYFEFQTNKS